MLKRKSDEIAIVSNSNDKGILTTTKATTSNINSVTTAHTSNALFKPIKRTSPLQSQIMQLSAHSAPVLTCKFQTNETGKQWIASGGFDGSISTLLYNIVLWNAWDEVQNWGVMKNVEPVLDLVWGRDGTTLFSCSSDTTISHWDISSGTKTRRFKGHKAIVNAISTPKRGQDLVASVSDDGLCKVWDQRAKDPVKSRDVGYPLLATSFSRDGDIVFIGTKPQLTKGGVNNEILAWDLKLDKQIYALSGHVDSITGLALSPSGTHLLSSSMDNTVCTWDIRPFSVNPSRWEKSYLGAMHGFEKNLIRPCWAPTGAYIASGSGDRAVVVWDVASGQGCVNQVDWADNMIVSASNDQMLILGELDLSDL